jgi:hypothetical protein
MLRYSSWEAYIPGLAVFYVGLLIVLCLIGAILAVASEENQKMKLLAIAVSAPAIITTWLGGAKADTSTTAKVITGWVIPITSASAQGTSNQFGSDSNSGFWSGFKIPFGIGKDEQRYRVIAGSFQNTADAERKVEEIKQLGVKAFVGNPMPGNPYFPVVVSDYLPYPEAAKIKDQVNKLLSINDAYLSPYPFR